MGGRFWGCAAIYCSEHPSSLAPLVCKLALHLMRRGSLYSLFLLIWRNPVSWTSVLGMTVLKPTLMGNEADTT